MAEQHSVARKRSRSKRDKQQEADPGTGKSGNEDEVARYEKELAAYLQERIKPGLNSGAIPLLARSIAKAIAHREHPSGTPGVGRPEDESRAEADDERTGEADDEPSAKSESAESEAPPDFEADMRELQAELGEHWILRFSVHGDEGWLTAETDDGSQRVDAQDASGLIEAVGLINKRRGRSA
jgi:hypothetical protein